MLWDVEFNAILSLRSEAPIHVRVQQDHNRWSLVSNHGSVSMSMPVFCVVYNVVFRMFGFTLRGTVAAARILVVYPLTWKTCGNGWNPYHSKVCFADIMCNLKFLTFFQGFYEDLLPLAEYGPMFQRVNYLAGSNKEWFAEIDCEIDIPRYDCHPSSMNTSLNFIQGSHTIGFIPFSWTLACILSFTQPYVNLQTKTHYFFRTNYGDSYTTLEIGRPAGPQRASDLSAVYPVSARSKLLRVYQ